MCFIMHWVYHFYLFTNRHKPNRHKHASKNTNTQRQTIDFEQSNKHTYTNLPGTNLMPRRNTNTTILNADNVLNRGTYYLYYLVLLTLTISGKSASVLNGIRMAASEPTVKTRVFILYIFINRNNFLIVGGPKKCLVTSSLRDLEIINEISLISLDIVHLEHIFLLACILFINVSVIYSRNMLQCNILFKNLLFGISILRSPLWYISCETCFISRRLGL